MICVVDYGAGNIESVLNMTKRASHAQLPTGKGRVGINQMQAQ
jgi:imidazoleglycerol phosphate synthase glutamine amidotransferase subunit HisH